MEKVKSIKPMRINGHEFYVIADVRGKNEYKLRECKKCGIQHKGNRRGSNRAYIEENVANCKK